MQAIARANRVYPGKDFGLIVDYNGMLKSLREALAQYALGDEGEAMKEFSRQSRRRVNACCLPRKRPKSICGALGFEPARLIGARGFTRIQALADAVDAVYTSDESKRRFENHGSTGLYPFQGPDHGTVGLRYAVRHDNIEAIYKKLEERRDTADVTELLKELHKSVNRSDRTQPPERARRRQWYYDLSHVDLEKKPGRS